MHRIKDALHEVNAICNNTCMTALQKRQALNRTRRDALRDMGFFTAEFRNVDRKITAAINCLPAEGSNYG